MEVPLGLRATHAHLTGPDGRPWLDAAPGLVDELLARWSLTPDGAHAHGTVAWIIPVRRADGSRAVLKIQPVDEETLDEPLALRTWAGAGAVLLLEHDRASGSLLLEALDASRSLAAVPDDLAALEELARLLARLTRVAAPPGLRTLADVAAGLLARSERILPTSGDLAPLVAACRSALREVSGEPGDRLLHWDLHYENVLAPLAPAPDRGVWLAIDPKPLAGDPGFDLLPAIHNRWDDVVATGDVAAAVRRRFDLMTDVVALDRERARAWTLARVLQNIVWDLEEGTPHWSGIDRAIGEILLGR